jgi:phage-related protein
MSHTKEYRKLSADQFRRLIGKLPEIRKGAAELQAELRSATSEKVREVLDRGIYWAGFYEAPFVQHVALALHLLGQGNRIIAI